MTESLEPALTEIDAPPAPAEPTQLRSEIEEPAGPVAVTSPDLETSGGASAILLFSATVFLSAFLLFQVQPLIARHILPWFGSSPGVWTMCLVFFQVMLLAGYAYAHLVVSRLSPGRQAVTHLCLLGLVLLTLPITPSEEWQPGSESAPTGRILLLLAACVGAPFFLLSTTGPLLQGWFARLYPHRSPYRLYALSNVGSLLALISYPFVIERFMPVANQTVMWSLSFGVFALLCGTCAWLLFRARSTAVPEGRTAELKSADRSEGDDSPRIIDTLLWVLLSACGSGLLLATTNQMSMDIAAVPFLWVLPLSLYLLTFILCFDSERWFVRPLFYALLPLGLINVVRVLHIGVDMGIVEQIAGLSAGLFLCCMCCHGELVRLKPRPKHLTFFFLMVSLGGALGGLFVAIVAPLIFSDTWEFHLLLVACCLLLLVVVCRQSLGEPNRAGARHARILSRIGWLAFVGFILYGTWLLFDETVWLAEPNATDKVKLEFWLLLAKSAAFLCPVLLLLSLDSGRWFRKIDMDTWWRSRRRLAVLGVGAVGSLGLVSLSGALGWKIYGDTDHVAKGRNFYGVLSIDDYAPGQEVHNWTLSHGRIMHGSQFLLRRSWPTTYYDPLSGIGIAIQHHPYRGKNQEFRIGVVGLGTGTVAAYANARIDWKARPWSPPPYFEVHARTPPDYLRYYEINPMVFDWANQHFTYLTDARRRGADVDVYMGDARIVMERQIERDEAQEFDVLAIDAFTGDAIPVHLLTEESLELYWKHLRPDGILAIHVTNRFLDLIPIVRRLGEELGKDVVWIQNGDDGPRGLLHADWMLMTSNPEFLASDEVRAGAQSMPPAGSLWTDDFSSIFEALQKGG